MSPGRGGGSRRPAAFPASVLAALAFTPTVSAQATQAIPATPDQAAHQLAVAPGALAEAQATLEAARAQVTATAAAVARLDAEIAEARRRAALLDARARDEAARLAAAIRSAYEGGVDGPLDYVLGGESLGIAMQREAELSRVARAMADLAGRLRGDRARVAAQLQALTRARRRLVGLEEQARAAAIVAADAAERLAAAVVAASRRTAAVPDHPSTAPGVPAVAAAPVVAATPVVPAPPATPGAVPSPTPLFTPDTPLTLPSGLDAPTIDAFLAATPLAGLGGAFLAAERGHRVSARFLVAVAVNESAWGRSRLARDKHNLFGWGADDRDPYGDAASFPSFTACIDAVSAAIARDYLSPSGRFYHGPTLRGVAVDYASDRRWPDKIAAIAQEIGRAST